MKRSDSIRLDPRNPGHRANRGNLRWRLEQPDAALSDCNAAVQLDPRNSHPLRCRALAWAQKGEVEKAIADGNEAIRLDPSSPLGFNNRAFIWNTMGQFDSAIADCNEALRLDPQFAEAFRNRGVAWHGKRECEKAFADLAEAIRLKPTLAAAFESRAWTHAMCLDRRFRDGQQAIQDATKACALTRCKKPDCLAALAAAYAAAGDFDASTEWQAKADTLRNEYSKGAWLAADERGRE
jgi:tetratricopeptide (TPR) repeat protein